MPAASPGLTPATCFPCGYDLRGLPAGARCPECGTPLADSPAGQTLFDADPRWLRRMEVGAWAVPGSLLGIVVPSLIGAAALDEAFRRGSAGAWGIALLTMAALATLAVGPWLLLSRPRHAVSDAARGRRVIGRIALLVAVVASTANILATTAYAAITMSDTGGAMLAPSTEVLYRAMRGSELVILLSSGLAGWAVAWHVAAVLRSASAPELARVVAGTGVVMAVGSVTLAAFTLLAFILPLEVLAYLYFGGLMSGIRVMAEGAVGMAALVGAMLAFPVALRLRAVRRSWAAG